MTYSLVARCKRTGMFGAAVVSSSPAVGARCIFAEAEIGAVATQNLTDPALGARTLDLMRGGAGAIEAIAILKGTHPHMAWRQLLAVDRPGAERRPHRRPGAAGCGRGAGPRVACAGNLFADVAVPAAAVAAFRDSAGDSATASSRRCARRATQAGRLGGCTRRG